jgi:hypothetical protein
LGGEHIGRAVVLTFRGDDVDGGAVVIVMVVLEVPASSDDS